MSDQSVANCAGCNTLLSEEFCGLERIPCPICGSTARNFNVEIRAKVEVSASIITTVFRTAFIDALSLLARACDDVAAQGFDRPILVGGAAVEFHTGGAIASGDFDFVTEDMRAFGEALTAYGFHREDRQGRLLIGWYHPDLTMGVQVVSGKLFDGRSDVRRLQLVDIVEGKALMVAPIEDLIADRMGQYASGAAPEMLGQAIRLFQLAGTLDDAYLDERIRGDSSGTYDLAYLKRQVR